MSLNSIRKLEELGIINNDTEYIKNCQGKCAHCGGCNISYYNTSVDDDYFAYHLICNDCGKESKEWYRMEYLDTEKIEED